MRAPLALLALLLLVPGCAREAPEPAERAISCALFDPAGPAANVALEPREAGERGAPAATAFVLEVSRSAEEGPFTRVRFPETGCAGVSLPGQGRYHFWAEAPEDEHCAWFDGAEATYTEGMLQVTLEPALACK